MLPVHETDSRLNRVPLANRPVDRCFTSDQLSETYRFMPFGAIRQYRVEDHSNNCRSIFIHLWDIVMADYCTESDARELAFAMMLHRYSDPANHQAGWVRTTAVQLAWWAVRQMTFVEMCDSDPSDRSGEKVTKWFRVGFREDLS
jgi:hypothetical protein